LQRGDIYFSNPVRIDPTIDINATARVETYDITVGLQGTMSNLKPTYRSEPPLSEADIFALLALGRTQEEAQLYQEQEVQQGANPTTSALLGGVCGDAGQLDREDYGAETAFAAALCDLCDQR
jgi:translocation and assembly module TamB